MVYKCEDQPQAEERGLGQDLRGTPDATFPTSDLSQSAAVNQAS